MAYEYFAQVYDALMSDFDYESYAKRLLHLFEQYDKKPTLLLDLACGTGTMSSWMMEHGIDTIAVDNSEEMLLAARQKSPSMLCLCQSAEDLDLYGTVDGAICTLDSLNHLTDRNQLQDALNKVSLFLEPGCLFLFDVNTVYKHQEVLADRTYVLENDSVCCVWQNQTDENVTEIALDFFAKQQGNTYRRFHEAFAERAYSQEEWQDILQASGLHIVDVLDFDSMQPPEPTTQRLLYITRKVSWED